MSEIDDGALQRAVKTLPQRTKAMLSPWMRQRVDNLHTRDQGKVENGRPLTLTHHNTQRLLRRVRLTREQTVAWKPDIGVLEPRLVKRFNDDIAGRARTLRLIGVRRQPAAPSSVWDSSLELTLPAGAGTPAGQVIERFSPTTVQGPSVFAAGQPIEPFKPTTPIPARSSRPTAAAKPTRKPASKPLPPQARLYARVEEIAPRGEMPERETRELLTTPVTPREIETPQPARERPTIQRAPVEETSQAEEIMPPAPIPPTLRVQRQAEPEPPAGPAKPATAPPRQPERRQTPPLPAQSVAAPAAPPAPQKPASRTSPVSPPAAIAPAPLTATRSPVEQTPPSLSSPAEAPDIQYAAETSARRVKPSQPRPAGEAPALAKPVAPVEAPPRLPHAIAEPPLTTPPAQARLPRALPVKPSPHTTAPVQRSAVPSAPRAAPGPRPQPEPPAAAPAASSAAIPPARPLTSPQPPPLPATMRPEAQAAMPAPPRVDIQRAVEPPRTAVAMPEPAEAQLPSPDTAPPEPRQAVTLPDIALAGTTLRPIIADTVQRREAAETAQPIATMQSPPTSDLQPPTSGLPSPIPDLPLRQVIQRRADARSHGLLRQPASPPTLRPLVKSQPRQEAREQKLETGDWKLDAGNWIPDTGYWKLDAGRERPASKGAAALTLYARSPNMFVGPGPAPTVTRRTPPTRRGQEQKRAQGDQPASQPPMDLRMAMGAPSAQLSAFSFQPAAGSAQPSAFNPPPAAMGAPQLEAERPAAMPLARQQPAPSAPAQILRPPAQMAEPITQPSIVGELVQRDAIVQRVEEENKAPESVNLGELARRVYPFVKRLIAIERERSSKT